MPWRIHRRGSRYCVIREGESSPVPGGCHATKAEARRHQKALYAGEATTSGKEETVNNNQNDFSTTVVPLFPWWSTGSGTADAGVTFPQPQWTGTASPWFVQVPSGMIDAVTWQQTAVMPDTEESTDQTIDWEGVLAIEGVVTSDGRYLMPGKIGHRDLPLTLMAQTTTDEGHNGAFAAGKITEITKEQRPDLGPNAVAIIGRGSFADTPDGQRAEQLVQDEILRGVSIDFSPSASYLLDPETLKEIPEEELDLGQLLGGNVVRGFEGDIMGATLCAFPAFEDATMQIVETPDKVVVACAFPPRRVLTASAAGMAPLNPPYDWFYAPEPDGPCPLTVTDDGQVFGHLALWNQCHRGQTASCELAPRSRTEYAFFHTGALTTDDGRKVNVGRITVGDKGHAGVSSHIGTRAAVEHYDKTGIVGAFVRAQDGKHGIWLSGAVRSDCPAEKVRDMEANPPSGDWRDENGRLELCAALSVPVAGFPVPRYEAALVASGSTERVVALVASGYTEGGGLSRADQRRIEMLKAEGREAFTQIDESAWDSEGKWLGELESEEFQPINAEQRRRAAQSGAALPDGSFPITKCSGEGPSAENAIRAQGRAAPGKRGRVRAHIRKRVRALGCSGGIFDPYK